MATKWRQPPAIAWKNLRLPAELHGRLKAQAERMQQRHEDGQYNPEWGLDEFLDRGQIPLWFVIQRALDDFEGHLERSKGSTRRADGEPAAN